MSRTITIQNLRTFLRARVRTRRPTASIKLRLDGLEARIKPGDAVSGLFTAFMLEPLSVMASIFGETALLPPNSPLEASPADPPTSSEGQDNPLASSLSVAYSGRSETSAITHSESSRPIDDTPGFGSPEPIDLSITDLFVLPPGSVEIGNGGGGGSGGGADTAPGSRFSDQSSANGPATFDPVQHGNGSAGMSLSSATSVTVATDTAAPVPSLSTSAPVIVANSKPQVWVRAVAPETPAAGGVGGFLVWRDGTGGDLEVTYKVGGTAAPGSDYQPLIGRVVIEDGNRVAAIPLEPVSLNAESGRRAVSISLATNSRYLLGSENSATARLGRFDARPMVSVIAESSSVGERSPYGAAITFVRTTSDGPLAVEYTVGGTAKAGSDYTSLPGTAVIPAGSDRVTVWIRPVSDELAEGAETLTVTASPSAAYDLSPFVTAKVTLTDTGEGELPPEHSISGPTGLSSHPIRYWDGLVIYQAADLATAGFGHSWGIVRKWSNIESYATNGAHGNGWAEVAKPYLIQDLATGAVGLIQGGDSASYFDWSGSAWVPRSFTTSQMTTATGELVLTDGQGNEYRFADFSSSNAGHLKKFTDAYGNVTEVTSWWADGKPAEVRRSATVGGSTVTEAYVYAYISSGTNSGKVESITLTRGTGSSPWPTVRKVEYAYYDGVESNGSAGDLKTAVIKDASSVTLNTEYYRYFTSSGSGGYAGGLKYAFRGDSYARLKAWADANSTTAQAATDSQVSPYSDHYFEYDSNKRVTTEVAKGAGNGGSLGGQGTFTFSYTAASSATGPNEWLTKTVETLPDGNQNIIYVNSSGAVLLSAYKNVATGDQWPTYNHYDSAGRKEWTAYSSALTGYSDTYADLLNFQLGVSSYLRDDSGLFQIQDYYTSTTATSSTPGGVSGYLKQTSLRRGELGTAVPQERMEFLSRTSGGQTIYRTGTLTRYRNDNGTGGQTLTYGYTWSSSGFGPTDVAVTYPAATTGQNGSGSTASESTNFDSKGYPHWFKDAAGYLHFRAFNVPTGAVEKSIADVNSSQTSDFTNMPSGWSTPTGGGLHLITLTERDARGRPTKLTDPNGNVTYSVFDDDAFEVRVYPGWNTSSSLPTGPTVVVRADPSRAYLETLTMSATPAVTDGRPTGTESISGIQSLSRTVLNDGCQVTAKDIYTDLTGVSYSQSSVTLGTSGTNYNRTLFDYDSRGRSAKTVTPSGTIYRDVFDGQSHLLSKWVGTDDTPTSGTWSPTNTSGTDLVKVWDGQYDGNSIGDGNLTKETQYPGGGTTNRVTDHAYDWRRRPVATKLGVETSEGTGVNRPIFYSEFDNLNQIVASERYDGDTLSITTDSNSDGVPDRPSSSALRAKSTGAFDEQGHVYQAKTFSVDPANGNVSTNSLISNYWYNTRGLAIKSSEPGGLVAKNEFNGLGWATKSYLTDGGGDSAYGDADDVTIDNVLVQTEWSHNANGGPILVTVRDRFHDETDTGSLGTPTTGVNARVSYAAMYYDKANRKTADVNVGTNAGSSYTRPSTVPSRSDTVLVSDYSYNAAGWLETTTDPKALVSKQYYNLAGWTTKTIENYVNGTVSDTDDKSVEFTFNGNGAVKTLKALLTSGYQTTENVFGVSTSGGLVSNDIVGAVRHPNTSSGDPSSSEQETYTVNQLGEVLTYTDRNGNVHTHTRDVLGRITSDAITTLGSGVDGTVRRIETAFDSQGNAYLVTSYDAASGGNIVNQVQREFNGLGQLITEWQAVGGAVNTSTSPKVQYAYSFTASGSMNHSRLTSITYPIGRVITYNYASGLADNISRLSSITDGSTTLESYEYLGLGIVVKRGHAQPGVDLTFIKQSGESNGDAGDQYIGLDRFGRIADQRWRTSSADLERRKYGYDRDSNRLYAENTVNTARSELYAYEGLNQLTSFDRGTLNGTKDGISGSPLRAQDWDFDALGNWDSLTTDGGSAQTRGHNKQNEITSISGATTPTYDANGNLTTGVNGNTFKFDAWNHLVEARDSGSNLLATYRYDGLGRRIRATHGSTTTDFYYSDEWQVLEERVGNDVKRSYVWSPVYVDAMIARDRDTDNNGSLDERLYSIHDANFNIVALVNTSGNVVERYAYDAFGSVTFMDGSWGNRSSSSYAWTYTFQGLPLDTVTGLLYARHRDLEPVLGRPLQRDPMGFDAGDPNLYRWEGNMPGNVTDPSGLMWVPPPHMTKGWTKKDHDFHVAMVKANGKVFREAFWPWNDGEMVDDDSEFAIYGGEGSGGLTKEEAFDEAKKEIRDFMEYLEEQAAIAIIAAIATPAVAAGVAKLLEAGWKVVKVGNQYFLKKGNRFVEVPKACFAAGTPVRTPDGDRAIEHLQPGDVVLARAEDDPNAPVQARVVEDVFRRSAPVMSITIGGQQIRLTEEHPFYTQPRGWTPAHELRVGDWVLGEGGEWLPIGKVEPTGEMEVVYNICVSGAHTFFVGRRQWGFAVWVHNKPVAGGGVSCFETAHNGGGSGGGGGSSNGGQSGRPTKVHPDSGSDTGKWFAKPKGPAPAGHTWDYEVGQWRPPQGSGPPWIWGGPGTGWWR